MACNIRKQYVFDDVEVDSVTVGPRFNTLDMTEGRSSAPAITYKDFPKMNEGQSAVTSRTVEKDTSVKPQIVDDKSPHCIPFILSRLREHQRQKPGTPFFIGLNGVQGAGKTTLVKALAETLQNQEHLETLVCSIDDLYLKHEDQVALARSHPNNPLVQHRGEPGTHDMRLAKELFTALQNGQPTKVPQYDKSAFQGHGDRVDPSKWQSINGPSSPKIQVIIFEGWCVGFRALEPSAVTQKQLDSSFPTDNRKRTLHTHRLEDLQFINEKLREYDVINDALNAFILIDAEETEFVYKWRLQQEQQLRREKGTGMSDEEVVRFVDGYYPAYELFTGPLREGLFGKDQKGKQLRLIIGEDRKVKEVIVI